MHDSLLDEDLRAFRASFRKFVAAEITPFHAQWEKDGVVPRALYKKAGDLGFLCTTLSPAYGGMGLDFRSSAIVCEELTRAGAHGPFFSLHSDVVAPYIEHHGSEAHRQKYLPKMASGELIGAIAMTEPGTGSDLQAIRTRAVVDGEHLVIDGSKTFISNGLLCDFVLVACRLPDEGADDAPGWQQMSLVLVDADAPGFVRGKKLDKVGLKAQDTTELHFESCRVPHDNVLGARGQGFLMLMTELARERLVVAVGCVAAARACLDMSVAYVKDRVAFGKPLSKLQHTRFQIAEMATEVELGEAFVDRCIQELTAGELSTEKASMAKWWTSEMLGRVADTGVQLHGGYGYMHEYPIARAWLDARVQRIYAGTTEIMKEIIARAIL
ncbi:MAG: acyl-CoA dehydrogenase [Deltaproteobacteria bacterium]|nr:acyl-CoA dehydrogenase [Deltaproteobacteria bacterium]